MWYFSWILGTAMAILFAVVNAMWLESQEERDRNASGDA
ncbi:cytochrome bd-I oxidase subunit CydX [Azoarcus sp. TTM-91]|jgi:cytochrome bd-I ubiquinol oxidase subunit X|nr:cytochrome bd-I oxidase subunit CydX [Azoarcus sp. TTM-91]NMG34036.1 cytochrome bd-I oxidase subunit CydX [Azoarcus sp. TTM-91]